MLIVLFEVVPITNYQYTSLYLFSLQPLSVYFNFNFRVPRIGNSKGEGQEPWAVEGKEMLRSRLIGRQVSVLVDYVKGTEVLDIYELNV